MDRISSRLRSGLLPPQKHQETDSTRNPRSAYFQRTGSVYTLPKNQQFRPMANRKRNIQILFCVSPEEKKLIRRKMIESKIKNMGAYLRKMAIDGYIVNTDTTPMKKQYEEMHKIGVNINQIAKKVNSTGDLYPEEMQELKEMVKELWRILRSSPLK